MRRFVLLALVCAAGCGGPDQPAASPVKLKAENGTTVFAELVKAKGDAKGVVLMFHQAGSNRHEYGPIAPRVAALGWDCLKVDQRSGGDMWGEKNETAAQFTGDVHYSDAYADMEAALRWAESKAYKRLVAWGSSYSASLALLLGSEHDSVDGVVAFSPGEYFDEEGVVAKWNSEVEVPVFFGATREETTTGDVYKIHDTKPQVSSRELDMVFDDVEGVHGSSALREDKNPKAFEKYWTALEKWMRSFESGGKNFGG